jgi:ribosomal protein L29
LQNVAEYSIIKKNIARLYNMIGNKKWLKEFYKER